MNVEKLNWLAKHGDIWAMMRDRAGLLLASLGSEVSEEARLPSMPKVSGTIAVMPLRGTLTQAGSEWFDGTSTDAFGRAFSAALAHQNIAGIVIDINSPGGSVYGTAALAEKVYEARGVKPVVAVANSLAASAAYWIGAAAEKLFVTPHGDVGSIGVFSMHEDLSAMLEKAGVNITMVSAGKYKIEGNPFAPLDDEARAEMQRRVDAFYGDFVGSVAKYRGVRVSDVKNGFGEGRVVNANAAKSEGMVDGVVSLEKVLQNMVGTVRRSAGSSASIEAEQEIHAAYVGAIPLPEAASEPETQGESEEAIARRKEREARVAQLRASERAERVKEMEEV